ncbi:hypothetical protein [Commensalibacter papalotli (ex Botero et al. 2024)]|uniref:Glycosyltransferase involved in cell wall bisynthesis (RfaB) (PDB:2IV7) n=1 Tax=Commensalibacter papalotli (ex Botero et al. 2024) TaxID=2972766 RepID=A0ABM9HKR2_9PROT|nr:hypothetical protein [Commensalibacter papalotli (ex Botero et al. 2024)]CAI3930431.1 Glycosyltransferase involved in cell wall bisynthesis (RfaB) (PDB:2IV7) [Commensalibacter papalotli (ex Botero et al. 2024)]CAI3948213.1 Glycosyltransferase involved in cell wall bisynthesis (RfaB) (PDB:2IV7) [Commensalibacter papalotli (ex Botero et al. 2024)]
MSDGKETSQQNPNQQRVIDLNVNGHLMSLGEGLYCIYHAPGQSPADNFGFPGLRISLPPFKQSAQVTIETFENDGWLGAEKSAALIRISGGSGLILVTVYQNPSSQQPAPKLQVVRLNDAPELISIDNQQVPAVGMQQPTTQPQASAKQTVAKSQNDITVFAHVQGMGDVVVQSGEWVGNPDSKTWIEGFGLNIKKYIQPDDIEYQAVLGKGWMSPWYKGDQFCGSRGMALPLCGLRVKLSEEAAKKYHIRLSATFVDGTKVGPIEDDSILSAESVAPLEAICFELISLADGKVVSRGGQSIISNDSETTPPKKVIRKIVPAKSARSNVKLKTTAAKAAAAKVAEQKSNNKKSK